MDEDELVIAHYVDGDEAERLQREPRGVLERLRTWDLFERWLPADGVVYDIGGAAGVHARWLAERGFDVELFDPVSSHVSRALETAESLPAGRRFVAEDGDARRIPRADESADVVLMLGPLYHLVETAERLSALGEASRLLKPGGTLLVAGISRFAWLMDAYRKGIADSEEIQASITYTVETGRSQADPTPGSFWAYFHRPEELIGEVQLAGFDDAAIAGVEGFAWMLPDLGEILSNAKSTEALLDKLRLVEHESSVAGASAHLLVRAVKAC